MCAHRCRRDDLLDRAARSFDLPAEPPPEPHRPGSYEKSLEESVGRRIAAALAEERDAAQDFIIEVLAGVIAEHVAPLEAKIKDLEGELLQVRGVMPRRLRRRDRRRLEEPAAQELTQASGKFTIAELVAVLEAGRDGSQKRIPVGRVHLKPNGDYEYSPMSVLGANRTRRDCRNDVNDPQRAFCTARAPDSVQVTHAQPTVCAKRTVAVG
jgi:hypothetical protein